MARYTKEDQIRAQQILLEEVKPGFTLHTILRHVSSSRMTRHISVVRLHEGGSRYLDWSVGAILGYRLAKCEGLVVTGCGMDMGFQVVYNLSAALFPNGFDCINEHCPANDHSNVRKTNCPICGAQLGERFHYTRKNRGWDAPVCSQACASAVWHHRDGGYAINQQWL